jgi:superfamily II DNA or RNA helicase
MSKAFLIGQFPDYEILDTSVIIPQRIDPFELTKKITLKPEQEFVYNALIKDLFNIHWFVNLQTGFGKTLIATKLMGHLAYKTIVICFTGNILDQWVDTLLTKTTISPTRILFVDSSAILARVLAGDFNYEDYDIFLSTHNLLLSFGKRNGFENLSPLFHRLGIGLRIYDEAHLNKGNIIRINALTNVRHTLYLSADYAQAREEIQKKYYAMMEGVPIITPPEEYLRDLRYTQAVILMYNSYPTMLESESIWNGYGFDAARYMEYQLNKGTFLKVLYYVLDNINQVNVNKWKTLILFRNIDHVNRITDALRERYPDMTIGRYHEKVEADEANTTRDKCEWIISTYQSFGTGIDDTKIKYVVGCNQSNKVEDNQAAGRARPMTDGGDVYYFMIVDTGFSYNVSKLKKRLEYLRKTKLKKVTHVNYNGGL